MREPGLRGPVPGVETGRIHDHPYVRVGSGSGTPLVFVPGLNDALYRVTESRWYAALAGAYCRRYADDREVYMVSRPPGLPEGTTTREMALGYARVLASIRSKAERSRTDVIGLSMGGFLVTHLAADRPDLVNRAVLALAGDRLSERGRSLVGRWGRWGDAERWRPVYLGACDAVASGPRRRALRSAARAYDLFRDPATPRDFRVSVRACLDHDASARLAEVGRPALVVGGEGDPFFSVERFRETADGLAAGRLALLGGASHEAVLAAPRAFEAPIREFLEL